MNRKANVDEQIVTPELSTRRKTTASATAKRYRGSQEVEIFD